MHHLNTCLTRIWSCKEFLDVEPRWTDKDLKEFISCGWTDAVSCCQLPPEQWLTALNWQPCWRPSPAPWPLPQQPAFLRQLMSQLLAWSPWWCFVEDDEAYLQLTLVSYAERSSISSISVSADLVPTPRQARTTRRKRELWFSLGSIFMLWWNTQLHTASCCFSESYKCVIATTWGEAGRPLLVTTRLYNCCSQWAQPNKREAD